MKFSKILLAILLTVFAFISCSDDDPKIYNPSAVRFDASIGEQGNINLKMSGAAWDPNDQIGVFMKKAGQGLAGNIVGLADNIKHTTPGNGKFSPALLSEGIEYPADGSNVDFIAYYPYTTPVTNYVYKVNVANQASQPNIDLLYSNNATNMNSGSTKNVGLNFTHELTKIVINVEAGTGIGSLAGLVTTLTGTNTQADFALADGTLTSASSVTDIQMLTAQSGIKMVSEAIVLPAAATAGRTILFTLGTQTFKWDVPATTAFEKGKRYTYDAVLSVDGVDFITPDATITDWTDVPGGQITPELQGGGDGSQSNPYTIDQVSSKVGETGKWVTGYIVGSTAKTKVGGTPSTENILIAPTATETNEANCIPVDISSSTVKANLDIVAHPELIGKQVKVQGDIVNTIFGGTLSMTNIVAQVGGHTGGGGDPVEFFRETFGTGDYPSGNRPKIAEFTDFDMKAPYVFTDSYNRADIRSTGTISASVWLPAYSASYDASSQLKISGIAPGYTQMSLSYDIATNNVTGADQNIIVVKCNDVTMNVPSKAFTQTNQFVTVTIDIPDNTTVIEFFSDPNTNKQGYRLDNIVIKGAQ